MIAMPIGPSNALLWSEHAHPVWHQWPVLNSNPNWAQSREAITNIFLVTQNKYLGIKPGSPGP